MIFSTNHNGPSLWATRIHVSSWPICAYWHSIITKPTVNYERTVLSGRWRTDTKIRHSCPDIEEKVCNSIFSDTDKSQEVRKILDESATLICFCFESLVDIMKRRPSLSGSNLCLCGRYGIGPQRPVAEQEHLHPNIDGLASGEGMGVVWNPLGLHRSVQRR